MKYYSEEKVKKVIEKHLRLGDAWAVMHHLGEPVELSSMTPEEERKVWHEHDIDYAEAVSSNSEIATDFLTKKGINVGKYVAKALESIRKIHLKPNSDDIKT